MVGKQDKFDAANSPANPPGEMYAVAPPNPELVPVAPPIEPIIPETVPDDGSDEDGALGEFQFTLSDLFMVTTALSVLLGIMSLLKWKWQYAAGLAGIGAFVSLLVITIVEPRRVVKTFWWSFFGFYLLACLVAVITGG